MRLIVTRNHLGRGLRHVRSARKELQRDLKTGHHEHVWIDGYFLCGFATRHFASGHLIPAVATVHWHFVASFGRFVHVTVRFAKTLRAAQVLRGVPRGARIRNVEKRNRHKTDSSRYFPLLDPCHCRFTHATALLNNTPIGQCEESLNARGFGPKRIGAGQES